MIIHFILTPKEMLLHVDTRVIQQSNDFLKAYGVDGSQCELELRASVEEGLGNALVRQGVFWSPQPIRISVLDLIVLDLVEDLTILIYQVEIIDDLHTILQSKMPHILWLNFKDLQ